MPNPYAPRAKRAEAPGFPSGRFARLGANQLQVAVGEWMWNQMAADEQVLAAEYLAGLADDELRVDLADDELADPGDLTLDELVAVHDWATEQVTAGTYSDRNEALEDLDGAVADLQVNDEENAKREAAGRHDAALLAELVTWLADQDDPEAAAEALRVLGVAEHEPQPRDENGELIPTPNALTGVVPAEGGPVDPANIPVGEQPAGGVPGGPGTTDGGAADTPAAPSPSGADQVLDEEAALRISGSVDSLMEWIGDDPAKAGAVRRAEQAKPEADQRKTLHERLDKLVGTPDAG